MYTDNTEDLTWPMNDSKPLWQNFNLAIWGLTEGVYAAENERKHPQRQPYLFLCGWMAFDGEPAEFLQQHGFHLWLLKF